MAPEVEKELEDLKINCSTLDLNKSPAIIALIVQDESSSIIETTEKVENLDKLLGNKEITNKGCKRYWGLGLGVLSSILFSFATLAVKLLTHYDPILLCFWRFFGIFLASTIVVLYTELFQGSRRIKDLFYPINDPEKLKCLAALLLRGTAGTGSNILFNMSLHYLNLSDATVIAFSTPVFTTLFARIFLKEHCGLLNVLAVIITLFGVGVITRPSFLLGQAELDSKALTGSGLALGSMALLCIVYLCLRVKSVKKLNFSMVTLCFGFVGSVQCAILSVLNGTFTELPITLNDLLLALLMSSSTYIGQVCATLACKYEEAGNISLLRTLGVVWAFILQFIFFSEIPNSFSLIGSLVILSGIFFVVLQKYIRNLQVNNSLFNKLAPML